MKKTIVLFSSLALISLSSMAQTKDTKAVEKAQTVAAPAQTAQPAAAPANPDLSIKFKEEEHNFGNVATISNSKTLVKCLSFSVMFMDLAVAPYQHGLKNQFCQVNHQKLLFPILHKVVKVKSTKQ